MEIKQIIKRAILYIFKGVPVQQQVVVRPQISYLSPHNRMCGKKVIVTGGNRGLGYAMAKRIVEEGGHVVIAGRNEDSLRKASDKIGCPYVLMDVLRPDTFDSFMASCEEVLPGINGLINNAGISLHEGDFRRVEPRQFNVQFDTNLRGSYFMTQAFVHLLESRNRLGVVLLVSSETGETVDYLPYGLTKASIHSLTKGLAKYLIKSGIRVNTIAPGVTASDMTGFASDGNLYCPYNLTHRAYLPEEVAEVACFLLSDAASILNGQILVTNEGKTINLR